MKLCRSEWGLMFLSIPACLARRRTTRAAWCRFMRSPVPVVKIGPSLRSPTARYTVRAVRGASGTMTVLPPFRFTRSV